MKLPSTVIGKVKYLLEKYPHLRDNDNKLIANIWHFELKEYDYPPEAVLTAYAEGQLTSPETIRRCRQKIQQEFEQLRGDTYKERQKKTGKVVKDLKETPEFYKGGTP